MCCDAVGYKHIYIYIYIYANTNNAINDDVRGAGRFFVRAPCLFITLMYYMGANANAGISVVSIFPLNIVIAKPFAPYVSFTILRCLIVIRAGEINVML